MHPAIRIASLAALGAADPDTDDAPAPAPGAVPAAAQKAKALAKKAGGAVLDRVADRAATATAGQVDQLREELARTRRELEAEITLLRAELAELPVPPRDAQ